MTIAELEKIRTESLKKLKIRKNRDGKKIIITMGDSGVIAGSKEILNEFMSEFSAKGINDVSIILNDSEGKCELEPIVYYYKEDGSKEVFTNVTKATVKDIVKNDILGIKSREKALSWRM